MPCTIDETSGYTSPLVKDVTSNAGTRELRGHDPHQRIHMESLAAGSPVALHRSLQIVRPSCLQQSECEDGVEVSMPSSKNQHAML